MKTNWEDIKQKYITSNVSYRELAGEFSLSERTIRTRAAKEKWRKARDEHKTKTGQKIQEAVQDELVEAYKKAIRLAKQELIEELELNINIRKSFDASTQWGEKRLATCIDNNKKIIETIERMAYPQREDKSDNKTVFVVGQDVKELF